MTVDFQYFW